MASVGKSGLLLCKVSQYNPNEMLLIQRNKSVTIWGSLCLLLLPWLFVSHYPRSLVEK